MQPTVLGVFWKHETITLVSQQTIPLDSFSLEYDQSSTFYNRSKTNVGICNYTKYSHNDTTTSTICFFGNKKHLLKTPTGRKPSIVSLLNVAEPR